MKEKLSTELIRVGGDPDRMVDAIVAFIAIDPKTGLEGIMSLGDSPDRQLPLIASAGNPALEHMAAIALQASQKYGTRVERRRYECVSREVLK